VKKKAERINAKSLIENNKSMVSIL